jgi:hypothetical protein
MSERYLANENFPVGVVQWLIGQGGDVVHAGKHWRGSRTRSSCKPLSIKIASC